MNFSQYKQWSRWTFTPSVPETKPLDLKAGDQLQVDLDGMKFSPVVLVSLIRTYSIGLVRLMMTTRITRRSDFNGRASWSPYFRASTSSSSRRAPRRLGPPRLRRRRSFEVYCRFSCGPGGALATRRWRTGRLSTRSSRGRRRNRPRKNNEKGLWDSHCTILTTIFSCIIVFRIRRLDCFIFHFIRSDTIKAQKGHVLSESDILF